MLFLADTPQKVDKIHRAICFAYSCISSIQFKSEVQLLRIRIAVNAIFLAHFCPSSFVSNQIYHRIDYCSHLAGDWSQSQKLRNGQIFLMNNNKICWTRYRIEKCITTYSEKTFDTSLDQSWLIFWLDEKVAMNAATGQPEQTEAIKPPNQNSKQRYAAPTKRGKTCGKEFQLVQPNTWYENFKPIAEWSNSFLLSQLWQLCCLTLAQCGLPPTDIISSS